MTMSLLLCPGRIVLPDTIASGASLLLESGRIARVYEQPESGSASADSVMDLDGLTLFPGFIDVHIHGAVGIDTMAATPDGLHRVSRFLARHGCTGWLPTLVPAPEEEYGRTARAVEQLICDQGERPPAARVLGLHYEGPFVNSVQCGALRSEYFRRFTGMRGLSALISVNVQDAVHMVTVAPEIDGGIELVRELCQRGWIISIGHTRASVQVLELARAAGARHMTHLMNAMVPIHHRSPGPVGWGLLRDDVTCDVIADGVHIDPLMLRLALRCKTPRRLVLISDAIAPTGLGNGEYRVWGQTIMVTDGRTNNAGGSIAGSVTTMRDAVQMMGSLGVAGEDVARMAATNPARLLGMEQECGSIEEGKRADLVALDEKGRVRLTLVVGRVAFNANHDIAVEL